MITETGVIWLGLAAVAVLLALVIWVRMPAFVALLLVSLATAVLSGIPLEESVGVVIDGVGKTLGSVVVVVGLGAMLGKIIEESGGATALAEHFTDKLGRKRIAAAVVIAAFILGIPVFFDVGFIILAPIVFSFAAVAKINPIKIGLPVAAALLTVHVVLPPHPGPVAVAEILDGDAGLLLTIGLPLAAATVALGYMLTRRIDVSVIERAKSPVEDAGVTEVDDPPSPWTIIGLILLPIILIMLGTTSAMALDEGSGARNIAEFIGASPVALLIAVVVSWIVLGRQRGWNRQESSDVLDAALPAVAVIIFVTGAGGAFANVLVDSGIGQVLSDLLAGTGLPLILTAFLLAAALRAAQGSATVALLTTAGLMTQPIADAGLSSVQATFVMVAIGFGGLVLSHINDSGFWIVTKYLGLSVKQGLRYWTTVSTAFGLIGFLLTWAVYALV